MGIGQVLTMPLFFASNAIYPIDIMPAWLKTISHVNPLTYMINALRSCMLPSQVSINILPDIGILIAVSAVLIIIGGALYKRVIT
jgi:ABC-2 type transport system permease protein